jgi:hypothetical protein
MLERMNQDQPSPLRSKPWHRGHTDISKRHDGSYALWYCMSEGDLDLVPTDQLKMAIMSDLPYLNPLKWAIVAVATSREEAIAKSQAIRDTGLRQWLVLARAKSNSLLTGLEEELGASGLSETPSVTTVTG